MNIRRVFSGHRTESQILVAFVLLLTVGFTFAKAASEVMEGDTLGIDRALLLMLRVPGRSASPIGPKWLLEAVIDVTALGSTTVLTILTTAATGYLLAARKPVTAVFTVAAVSVGALTGTTLKAAYARARPDIVHHFVGTHSASFPSGHAMNSAIVYLTLAILVSRNTSERRVRTYLVSAAITLTTAVGFSRVYLGVHWPTDVAAGWSVGGLWAILCSLVAKKLQSRGRIKPSRQHSASSVPHL